MQVVNHGVSLEAMRDMEAVCQEFFALPAEDKAGLYSEDAGKTTRIYSSTMFDTGGRREVLARLPPPRLLLPRRRRQPQRLA